MKRLKKCANSDISLYVGDIMSVVKNKIADAEWEIASAAWAECQSTDNHTEDEKQTYSVCDEYGTTEEDLSALRDQITKLLTDFKANAQKYSASKAGL